MKAHKYWSLGAFFFMIMAMISGGRHSHKKWAIAAFGCMIMSVYSGHKLIRRKKKAAEKAKEK